MFFWNKKKSDTTNQVTQTQPIQSAGITLNLSKEESLLQLDLRKKELSDFCLGVNELNGLRSRVALVLDYSGSMERLYKNGTVQSIIERIMPIASQFDDNAELDLWIFESGFFRLGSINLNNFYGYVNQEILPKYRMGGTKYSYVMKDVYKKYIQEDESTLPNYVIFITDGDNFDKSETTSFMSDVARHPIFWQFVGIGGASFDYLERLDDLRGRYIDNADFFQLNDVNKVSDKELYKRLLTEYPHWIKEARKKGMIK